MKEYRSQQQSDSPRAGGGAAGSASGQAAAAQKPFAVFDIDGTLIRWQLYHAMADSLAKRGHIDEKAYASIRDARLMWKRRAGQQSFSEYQVFVIEAYEQALLQLSPSQLKQAVEDVFAEYKDQVYTYTRDLIKQLKKDGYLLFAISGSQIEIVSKIAEHYGFNDFIGTKYVVQGGRLTKHFPSADKKTALEKMVAKYPITFDGSIAVGDSVGDIPMLERVDTPIVLNPERELLDHARAKGWKIVIERKNVIYELKSDGGKYLLA